MSDPFPLSESAKTKLSFSDFEKLKTTYQSFDIDGNGTVSKDEVSQMFEQLSVPVTSSKVDGYFTSVGADPATGMNFTQFADLWIQQNSSSSASKGGLHKLFRVASKHAKHSISTSETRAYASYINEQLGTDPDLQKYLPINPNNDSLFTAAQSGLIMAKLVNLVQPETIPSSELKKNPKNNFEKKIICDKMLTGAKQIGCKVVNVGGADILSGKKHLILGILWQIIKASLMAKVSQATSGLFASESQTLNEDGSTCTNPSVSNNILEHLGKEGEDLETTKNLPPEQLLMRWVNHHLDSGGHHQTVSNFSADFSDATNYAVLISQIAPEICPQTKVSEIFAMKSNIERAEEVIKLADQLGCSQFVSAQDIVKGNPRLNLGFVATLFTAHPSLGPSKHEIAQQKAATELASSETKVVELTQSNDEMHQALSILREQNQTLTNSNKTLKKQIESLISDRNSLQETVEEYSKYKTAYDDLELLYDHTLNLESQLRTMKQEKAAYMAEMESTLAQSESDRQLLQKKLRAEIVAQREAVQADAMKDLNTLTQIIEDISMSETFVKQGHGTIKVWESRFFMLKNATLTYYKDEKDAARSKPLGFILCNDMAKMTLLDRKAAKAPKKWPFPVEISLFSKKKKYYFSWNTAEKRREWMKAMQKSKAQKIRAKHLTNEDGAGARTARRARQSSTSSTSGISTRTEYSSSTLSYRGNPNSVSIHNSPASSIESRDSSSKSVNEVDDFL